MSSCLAGAPAIESHNRNRAGHHVYLSPSFLSRKACMCLSDSVSARDLCSSQEQATTVFPGTILRSLSRWLEWPAKVILLSKIYACTQTRLKQLILIAQVFSIWVAVKHTHILHILDICISPVQRCGCLCWIYLGILYKCVLEHTKYAHIGVAPHARDLCLCVYMCTYVACITFSERLPHFWPFEGACTVTCFIQTASFITRRLPLISTPVRFASTPPDMIYLCVCMLSVLVYYATTHALSFVFLVRYWIAICLYVGSQGMCACMPMYTNYTSVKFFTHICQPSPRGLHAHMYMVRHIAHTYTWSCFIIAYPPKLPPRH
jgi:hypothetical protein